MQSTPLVRSHDTHTLHSLPKFTPAVLLVLLLSLLPVPRLSLPQRPAPPHPSAPASVAPLSIHPQSPSPLDYGYGLNHGQAGGSYTSYTHG